MVHPLLLEARVRLSGVLYKYGQRDGQWATVDGRLRIEVDAWTPVAIGFLLITRLTHT